MVVSLLMSPTRSTVCRREKRVKIPASLIATRTSGSVRIAIHSASSRCFTPIEPQLRPYRDNHKGIIASCAIKIRMKRSRDETSPHRPHRPISSRPATRRNRITGTTGKR